MKCITAGKEYAGRAQAGAVQQGKYLVYVHRHDAPKIDTLDVYDMSTGKIKVISKKGYAALVQNNKIYYTEVLREKEHYSKEGELLYDIPQQTVKIYSSSLNGSGKKLLGSFKTKGNYLRNYLDEYNLGDLAIIPAGTAVYVYMYDAKPQYYAMKYSNGKLMKSTKSVFNKKGKLAGLVSEGVTWAW